MSKEYSITAKLYAEAFDKLDSEIKLDHWKILREFLSRPDHTLTATQASQAIGFSDHRVFNLKFGAISGKFCKCLGVTPYEDIDGRRHKTSILAVLQEKAPNDEWQWKLRSEVVKCLQDIDVDKKASY